MSVDISKFHFKEKKRKFANLSEFQIHNGYHEGDKDEAMKHFLRTKGFTNKKGKPLKICKTTASSLQEHSESLSLYFTFMKFLLILMWLLSLLSGVQCYFTLN